MYSIRMCFTPWHRGRARLVCHKSWTHPLQWAGNESRQKSDEINNEGPCSSVRQDGLVSKDGMHMWFYLPVTSTVCELCLCTRTLPCLGAYLRITMIINVNRKQKTSNRFKRLMGCPMGSNVPDLCAVLDNSR